MAMASAAGTQLFSVALNVRPMESAATLLVFVLLLWVLISLDYSGAEREIPGHNHQCIHNNKAAASKHNNNVQVITTTTTSTKKGRNVNMSSQSSSSHIIQDTGLKIDLGSNMVCYPNEKEPVEFENECCIGRFLFLCQTDPPSWNSAMFEGRKHKFEMQIQVKLKVVPRGIAYMGVEINNKPKWGILTMTVANVALKFASTIVKSMHYSLGGRRTHQFSSSTDPLNEEKVHATFQLYRVVDRFVVTEEGGNLPVLGKAIVEESEEDRHLRVSGKAPDHEFTTNRWYTLCFYSCFIDFQAWKVVNIPGQGSLPITSFLGSWPFNIVVYTVDSNRTRHTHLAKTYVFSAEVSNGKPGTVGRRCETQAEGNNNSGHEGYTEEKDHWAIGLLKKFTSVSVLLSVGCPSPVRNSVIQEEL